MLDLIRRLCEQLTTAGVAYCHWKSTAQLDEALEGADDLDLFVAPGDRHLFEATVSEVAFFPVHHAGAPGEPLCHYIGLDENTGTIVHLHVYFRLITGGSILKSYRLPLEQYFTTDISLADGIVPVPPPEHDLGGLVIRRTLAFGSPIEYAMLRRAGLPMLYSEFDTLYADDPRRQAMAIEALSEALPFLDERLLNRCFDIFKQRKSFWSAYPTAWRLRRAFAGYALHSRMMQPLVRVRTLISKVLRRIFGGRLLFRLRNGGMVIAIVGGDASGKSTLAASLSERLSKHIKVERSHAGLPPPTLPTFIPRLLLPFARSAFPRATSTRIETEMYEESTSEVEPSPQIKGLRRYVFALRSVMLAYERMRLLTRLYRKAALDGRIVVLDRYPCRVPGAPDSPQINSDAMHIEPGGLLDKLKAWELRLYQAIPPADLVVRLVVPPEVAVVRNAERIKRGNETEEYVRRRHRLLERQDYSYCRHVVVLDASKSVDQVLRDTLTSVWKYM